MKKKICLYLAVSVLSAVVSAGPVAARETEDIPYTAEEAADGMKIDTEYENGTMTVTIMDPRDGTDNLWWQFYRGDKGDASCVECITESTQDGASYAGSFRAVDDGTDTIRLVRTDGYYVSEYVDFTVLCEDGKIKESTGGGQAFAVDPEELIEVIGGDWTEKDGGPAVMEISLGTDGGIDIVVSDGSGRDGVTGFYTMTVFYDAIKEALIYRNGTLHTAQISDKAYDAAEYDTEESSEGISGTDDPGTSSDSGSGYGALRLETESSETEDLVIYWDDLSRDNGTVAFVR